jgi:hypothetical protein
VEGARSERECDLEQAGLTVIQREALNALTSDEGNMIVYHGTSPYALQALLTSTPERAPRAYLKGKRAFATTTDFEIAALFALRRSPMEALRDERELGGVLEYEFLGIEGRDWVHAEDPGVLQDECEIAILRSNVLQLLAVYRMENEVWVRRELDEPAHRLNQR